MKSAHKGIVLCTKWHPDNKVSNIFSSCTHNSKNLIASGGRDGFVKVWNLQDGMIYQIYPCWYPESQPITTIGTLSGIGNITWRPGYNQLATVGLSNDFDIHIWSLNKPYIPLASVEFHTDVCKDFCFNTFPGSGAHDDNKFQHIVSCSTDGRVAQFDLRKSVTFPYKKLKSTSISWNPVGNVGVVFESVNRTVSPTSEDGGSSRRRGHRRNLSDSSFVWSPGSTPKTECTLSLSQTANPSQDPLNINSDPSFLSVDRDEVNNNSETTRRRDVKKKLSFDDHSISYSQSSIDDSAKTVDTYAANTTINTNNSASSQMETPSVNITSYITNHAHEDEKTFERGVNFRSPLGVESEFFDPDVIEYLATNYLFEVHSDLYFNSDALRVVR